MTTLVLDRTLKEVEWNDTHYPRPDVKKKIEAGCLTEKEIVFASTVPDGADLYHKNYLDYLSRTFGYHNSIVLAPQHFWYTGLCEIAQTVMKQPETHRKLFTRDPEGKTWFWLAHAITLLPTEIRGRSKEDRRTECRLSILALSSFPI